MKLILCPINIKIFITGLLADEKKGVKYTYQLYTIIKNMLQCSQEN